MTADLSGWLLRSMNSRHRAEKDDSLVESRFERTAPPRFVSRIDQNDGDTQICQKMSDHFAHKIEHSKLVIANGTIAGAPAIGSRTDAFVLTRL